MLCIGRQSISLSYGRCFAEFLNEGSSVRLGLLAQSTCVGFQYGYNTTNLRSFSWHPAHLPSLPASRELREIPWCIAKRIYQSGHLSTATGIQ